MVSRWWSVRSGAGNRNSASQLFALATPAALVSRLGIARKAMGRVWRRRLFRRVTVAVRFAVAIAAAERERRDSSQGDMDSLQTITDGVSCSGLQMRHRTNNETVGMEVWAAELSCTRDEWIDGVDGTKAPSGAQCLVHSWLVCTPGWCALLAGASGRGKRRATG